jgi:hypothetical protein
MAMAPAKRHAMRAMYEKRDQERKNARLGIKPLKTNKKGKRK